MSSKNKKVIKARVAKTQAKSKIFEQSNRRKTPHTLSKKNSQKEQIPPQKFENISFLVKARDLLSQVRFEIGYTNTGSEGLQLNFRHLLDMSFAPVLQYQLANPRAYPGILINWNREEKSWDGSYGTVRAMSPDGLMELDLDWVYLSRSIFQDGDIYNFVDISSDSEEKKGKMPDNWDIRFTAQAFAEAFLADTIPNPKAGGVIHHFFLHSDISPILDFERKEYNRRAKRERK